MLNHISSLFWILGAGAGDFNDLVRCGLVRSDTISWSSNSTFSLEVIMTFYAILYSKCHLSLSRHICSVQKCTILFYEKEKSGSSECTMLFYEKSIQGLL